MYFMFLVSRAVQKRFSDATPVTPMRGGTAWDRPFLGNPFYVLVFLFSLEG